MSLDKAILHKKEHRKPYRGSKAFDSSCRNHGSCPWCRDNRMHKFRDKSGKEEEINAELDVLQIEGAEKGADEVSK